MTRILVGECQQEVSTFNPVHSQYSDFVINVGHAILDYHRDLNTEMHGALSVFTERSDVELAPAYSALSITSAGPLQQADFDRIAAEFRESVAAALPVDAVYLAMHGAMQATEENDPEGRLLEITRELVGEETPIVISMDLHGIPTEKMLSNISALTAYHTYPHTDFLDTGERAARLLLHIVDGKVDPVMPS